MRIHHIRNATLLIETGQQFILVDPMLGKKGAFKPLTAFRFKPRRNPMVSLPKQTSALMEKVTHCLLTHKHPDHIDIAAELFLKEKQIPTICSIKDEQHFRKKGLAVVQTVDYWETQDFLGGNITGIPARHGYGFIAKPMGNVMGYYIEFPATPSIYISSDTIYTDAVEKVLKDFEPSIAIAACGSAQLDIGKPLLMHMEDIVKFVRNSPGKVIANHLEALNHCPTSRHELRSRLESENLMGKVLIPEDGDEMEF